MSRDELALLGHLIGDGCTLPRHAIQYTTREPLLATRVADLASPSLRIARFEAAHPEGAALVPGLPALSAAPHARASQPHRRMA